MNNDPLIRTEIAALALGLGFGGARHCAKLGILPPLAEQVPIRNKARGWRLSRIRQHNPAVAARCAAILAALENLPPKAA